MKDSTIKRTRIDSVVFMVSTSFYFHTTDGFRDCLHVGFIASFIESIAHLDSACRISLTAEPLNEHTAAKRDEVHVAAESSQFKIWHSLKTHQNGT